MRQILQGEVAFFIGLELIELAKGQISFGHTQEILRELRKDLVSENCPFFFFFQL